MLQHGRKSKALRELDEDLRMRGPGEFLGARQSGLPMLRFADLERDQDLLEQARDVAARLLDGDADRVIFVDEFGREVDGDHIMAICATRMLREGTLAKNTLVATVMSNMGLDIALRQAGGTVVKTAVGDRYVVEQMRSGGYNFGGEQSGHLIYLDYSTTGHGMLSAVQLLAIMQRTGRPLSELAEVMISLPQVLLNVRVDERRELAAVPAVQQAIRTAEEKLGDSGRVLIRYSGTEPLLRIMLEGQDKYEITALAHEVGEAIEKHLGGRREEK